MLYLLEPESPGPEWEPFIGVRPLCELRAGAWRIRERWEGALGMESAAILGGTAAGFCERDEPGSRPLGPVEGPAVIALSTFAPSGVAPEVEPETRRLEHEGITVGWIVPQGKTWPGPTEDGPAREIDGMLLRGAYDLILAMERFLGDDCSDHHAAHDMDPVPAGSIVLGNPADVILRGALVEPGVVFDVRPGAIVLEEGVEVRHGTRLEGPIYADRFTHILGGYIRNSVFGPRCNVRGEIGSSIFTGYANKAHDGFVGHTVLGQWVNLGAGTTTSNLKNTYGDVRLSVRGATIETKRTNVGSLIGDHAKTAIGTMLPTGTVIGAGASVFGPGQIPRYVPPLSWGIDGKDRLDEAGFLKIASRVMPRRQIEFTDERRESLRKTWQRLSSR